MSAALKLPMQPVKWSVPDCLKAEEVREVRHEYVGCVFMPWHEVLDTKLAQLLDDAELCLTADMTLM